MKKENRNRNTKRTVKPSMRVRSARKPPISAQVVKMKTPLYKTVSSKGLSQYRLSMIDPFDVRVNGVRLPNDFATPTMTKVLSGFLTLGAGTQPNAYLFTPSPVISLYSPQGNIPSGDMIPFNNFSRVYQAVDQSTLRTNFSSWRLVAGGIRVKSAMSSNATPIVISVATTPVCGSGPGPNFLNDGGTQTEGGISNIISDIIGQAPSTASIAPPGWGASINGMSNYNRFTTQDVTTQTLTIPFRVTDARAFDFKSALSNTGRAYVDGVTVADQVVYNATTGAIRAGLTDNEENFAFEGFSAIALDVKAVPAINFSALEIEYIYHLEGIPNGNATTTRNALYGTNTAVEAATHLSDIAWANRQGLYKIATAMSGTLFNSVDSGLISQILGLRI